MKEKDYWVYILNCDNGAYYAGCTSDLTRRYQEHLSGTSKCKYTRSFKPVGIAQAWKVEGKNEALKIEQFIKRMSKQEKTQLILYPESLMQSFSCKPCAKS